MVISKSIWVSAYVLHESCIIKSLFRQTGVVSSFCFALCICFRSCIGHLDRWTMNRQRNNPLAFFGFNLCFFLGGLLVLSNEPTSLLSSSSQSDLSESDVSDVLDCSSSLTLEEDPLSSPSSSTLEEGPLSSQCEEKSLSSSSSFSSFSSWLLSLDLSLCDNASWAGNFLQLSFSSTSSSVSFPPACGTGYSVYSILVPWQDSLLYAFFLYPYSALHHFSAIFVGKHIVLNVYRKAGCF